MKKTVFLLLVALLLLCGGCTPKTVETPPPTPSNIIPDDPAVKTDWSQLTPYERLEPIYTRRYAEFTDTLIPADDYGPLIPFLGDKLGGLNGEGCRYGLVTLQGEIVVDPVFSLVWQGGHVGNGWDQPVTPYFLVSKEQSTSAIDEWSEATRWALMAGDGSWITDFKYDIDGEVMNFGSGNADGLFVGHGSAMVYLDGATGEERLRIDDMPQENFWYAMLTAVWRDGMVTYADGDGFIAVNVATGERTNISTEEGQALRWGDAEGEIDLDDFVWCNVRFRRGETGVSVSRADGTVLAENLLDVYDLQGYNKTTGEKYARLPNGQELDFYDEDGALFATVPAVGNPTPVGDLFYVVTNTYSGLCTPAGDWIFRYPLPAGEWD